MPKPNKKDARRYTALWIVSLVSLLVWTEKAGASLSDILFGSPVWSVSCSGCTQSETFVPQTTLRQPYFVTSAVWSPDGKYLAVGSGFEGTINVYDTSSWRIVNHLYREIAGDDNTVIQFTKDCQSLLMPRIKTDNSYNIAMEIWAFKTSQVSDIYYSIFQSEANQPPYIESHDSRAKTVAMSQDYVAGSVGGSNNGYVLVFNKETHNILRKIECAEHNVPDAIAFSADQSDLIVAGCHPEDVERYNVKSGRMTFQTQVDDVWVFNFISYSPNGTLIAVGSSDSEHGKVTILKSEDGSTVENLPKEQATITNLQWINDHLVLASYDGWDPDGSMARVWDTNSQSLVAEFGGKHLQFTSISPDGRHLAAVIGNEVVIGNIKNMNPGN